MSHPIGEAVGYYAKRDERIRNSVLPGTININTTSTSNTNNNNSNNNNSNNNNNNNTDLENDILSPASPESRQKHKYHSKQLQPEIF
ncbi:unnamed protein product [Cunninghamella blakesleeana]